MRGFLVESSRDDFNLVSQAVRSAGHKLTYRATTIEGANAMIDEAANAVITRNEKGKWDFAIIDPLLNEEDESDSSAGETIIKKIRDLHWGTVIIGYAPESTDLDNEKVDIDVDLTKVSIDGLGKVFERIESGEFRS